MSRLVSQPPADLYPRLRLTTSCQHIALGKHTRAGRQEQRWRQTQTGAQRMREVGRQRERQREREREKERRGWCPAMQKMCCETHRGGSDHRFPAVAAPGRSFCASSRSPMWCERDRLCPLRAHPPPPSPPIRGELRLGVRAVRAQSFSLHAAQLFSPHA